MASFDTYEELENKGKTGDWFVKEDGTGIFIWIPKDFITYWPFDKAIAGPGTGPWHWNGSRNAPTLKPSLHFKASKNTIWHGFMTDGQLSPC